ncbi:N-acetylneuraminate synthase family protein [Thermanaerovibrio acidaminovorans]|uniref:N-acetylneuraminate synthase family protein n=1 Tax=Thermanaerovibrio acidaminovorans TaxID=81462 RepID=UPI0024926DA7|nr:N-acetylneuraminate synthase family protein [Thermanaerovibrio acidaminovorans]
MRIKVADNLAIGDGERCFVIAEVGANHNRSMSLAKELVDAAVEAKADAVKFQIYTAEGLYSRRTPMHSGYSKDLFSLIKEIETPRDWLPELSEYCASRGIVFFATPFDFAAVDELDPLSPLFKIASFELVDLPLISYCASKGKPMIISTGLATLGEIEDAYGAALEAGNPNVAFLQCASTYPAPPSIMNLRSMETIHRAFGTPVGLSDHTTGIHISVAAVAMGAKIIEKHFTLDRTMEGPDHPFAIEPRELCEMVRQIRDVEAALGDGRKLGPRPEEMEFYQKARRSVHAAVDIPAGTVITQEMLTVRRPGYGIRPKFVPLIVGRAAKCHIEADQWITWEMI